MRKIAIILSIILLSCSISFAQNHKTESFAASEQKKGTAKQEQVTKVGSPEKKNLVEKSTAAIEQKKIKAVQETAQPKEELKTGLEEQQVQSKEFVDIQKYDEDIQEIQSLLKILKIGVLVIFVLIITLLVLFFIDKRKRRDLIINTVTDENNYGFGHRLQSIIDRAVDNAIKQNQPSKPNSSYQQNPNDYNIQELKRRVTDLEAANINKKQEQTISQPISAPLVLGPVSLYADSIHLDGFFNRVSEQANEDTVFEIKLKLPSDTMARFTVYEGAHKRVLKNADFIEGCEKQKTNNQPTRLEVEDGTAELTDSGKWKITNKAKIKFV